MAPPPMPRARGLAERFRDPMTVGVCVSVALHAALLALRFAEPDPLARAASDSRLEVVLVNARTERRPERPEVRAQVDLEAGGDRELGRPASTLPASARVEDGTGLVEQRRRAEAFVEQQRRLLEAAHGAPARLDPDPSARRAAQVPGLDREEVERAIARLQAQLDDEISDGARRPRRLTYGVNAVGVNYARYVDDWARRVERIGTEQYPDEARGRLYDAMLVGVEIDRSGNVVDLVLHNPSRHEVLNRAVRRVVLSGAPYPRFTPEMARDGETLRIVRIWHFTNDALATRPPGSP